MFRPDEFRDLVSGRRQDVAASVLRSALRVAETPYTLALRWRNRRYDLGHANIERVAVPVVSVGNLTLGGTGKTPLVKWLARRLASQGMQPAIVSRGYRATSGNLNDEARELRQSLPNVPHVQNADRVAAARAAMDYHGCDVIVLDDGFQHRRLARDLDIVLLDALEPFGFDHVFPRGTLREPLAGLRRAGVVCLSRADAVSESELQAIRDRVANIAPNIIWCEIKHAPSGLINSARETQPLDVLRGKRVAAFCGIGNPAGFRHTLDSARCEVVAWREFPDHHSFSQADLAELSKMAEEARADLVICTHKDLVKVERDNLAGRPLWAVTIEIEFLNGQGAMEEMLARVTREETIDKIPPEPFDS